MFDVRRSTFDWRLAELRHRVDEVGENTFWPFPLFPLSSILLAGTKRKNGRAHFIGDIVYLYTRRSSSKRRETVEYINLFKQNFANFIHSSPW
jgi:hypothetical protein